MVVNQLLKYGEFGIVLFDNFQVTERTRNQLYLTVPWVRIPPLPPTQGAPLGAPFALAEVGGAKKSRARKARSWRICKANLRLDCKQSRLGSESHRLHRVPLGVPFCVGGSGGSEKSRARKARPWRICKAESSSVLSHRRVSHIS